jgi:hypothetical protein
MRTKLFHAIVLCGAALGAVGCSGGEDDEEQEAGTGGAHATGGTHHCAPGDVATGGTGEGGVSGTAAAAGSGTAPPGCGGWPTTK